MPWLETDVEQQRAKFVFEYQKGGWSVAELCELFGVSRKTGYKWLRRFEEGGLRALADMSRAPKTSPNRTPAPVVRRLLNAKRRRPSWGAKKILDILERKEPSIDWPARSTVETLFARHGLVRARKRRRRAKPNAQDVPLATSPNEEWAADFKGWFRTGDGKRCDPLTITDTYSRYCIDCRSLPSASLEPVKSAFLKAFRAYGLPMRIRTDNGTPFGSTGLGGFTRLSVWWLHLGVESIRIEPGKPQQNGKHERFHKTLKEETASPPKQTLHAQQLAFTRFARDYNEERPHEGIGMQRPAERYERSARELPRRIEPFEYPLMATNRLVDSSGHFNWPGGFGIYLGAAFVGERIGLDPCADDLWNVYLGPMLLGVLNDRARSIIDASFLDPESDGS